MYTARDTGASPQARPEPLGAQAYRTLKHRLLVGDFRLGVRLAEAALGEQLAMSRTPIREALSRLHAEGLLVRHDEGGFAPVAPDLHSIAELYEIRRSLEFTALARGDHDSGGLVTLRDDWQALRTAEVELTEGPEFVLHDEDFHVRLATAAGNRTLVDYLVTVNERIRIVRMHDFLTADRIEATIAEHLGIVEHLLEYGPETTRRLLDQHLAVSEQVVEERSAIALARMVGIRR
ncbi:MAG: GntR family transcriptional regulator [Actinomycetota bacterium]